MKKDYSNCVPVEHISQEKLWNDLFAQAEEAELDLTYQPSILVEHISDLTKEEWVQQRSVGFGGSDCGAIMGVNKFMSLSTLIQKKLGMIKEDKVSADKQYVFDYGHVMEDALVKYFGAVTGFEVFKDDAMYYHPNYPFMIADCDAFCIDNEGYKCLIECKTSTSENAKNWKSGIYGEDAVVPVISYIWQIRHYLSVLNLSRAYLIIGFDNQASKISIIRVDRDISEEVRLINQEYQIYVDYLSKKIVPKFNYVSKSDFELMKSNIPSNTNTDNIMIDEEHKEVINDFVRLQEKIKNKESEIKVLKESLDAKKLLLIQLLDGHESGICEINDEHEVRMSYKQSTRRGVDQEKLSYVYPNVYKDVYKPSTSCILKVIDHWYSNAEKHNHHAR